MQHDSFSMQSNFNYCRKVLSIKNVWINIKTKKCTPKSGLRWEFASVYDSLPTQNEFTNLKISLMRSYI